MGIVSKLKKWLDENEDDIERGSDKAIAFLQEIGKELKDVGTDAAMKAKVKIDEFEDSIKARYGKSREDQDSDQDFQQESGQPEYSSREIEDILDALEAIKKEIERESFENTTDTHQNREADSNSFLRRVIQFVDEELSKREKKDN